MGSHLGSIKEQKYKSVKKQRRRSIQLDPSRFNKSRGSGASKIQSHAYGSRNGTNKEMYNTLQAFNHTDIKSRDNRNHMVTPQLYAQVANMTNVKAPMSQD